MKVKTQAQNQVKLAARLYEVREMLKDLNKEEAILKSAVSNLMEANVLVAGEYVVSREERKAAYWDNEKLEQELGDKVKDFKKITVSYPLKVTKVKQ